MVKLDNFEARRAEVGDALDSILNNVLSFVESSIGVALDDACLGTLAAIKHMAGNDSYMVGLRKVVQADRAIGDPWGWVDWSKIPVTGEVGTAMHAFAAFDPDLKEHNGAYLQECRLADPFTDTVRPWATSSTEAELV